VFGATDYDLVRYVSYRDRLGLITANATTPYILNFIDLSVTGALLIELPPGPTAGGLSDFWQREFAIMGEMGPERGAGGRHVVVLPGQEALSVDPDVYVHRSTWMNLRHCCVKPSDIFGAGNPSENRGRRSVHAGVATTASDRIARYAIAGRPV